MIGKAIDEEALRLLLSQNAVREARAFKFGRPGHWTLEIRLGGHATRWIPIRSKREPVRTWGSLTALGRFTEAVGLMSFLVEH